MSNRNYSGVGKLPHRCGFAALNQLNPVYKKDHNFFLKKVNSFFKKKKKRNIPLVTEHFVFPNLTFVHFFIKNIFDRNCM